MIVIPMYHTIEFVCAYETRAIKADCYFQFSCITL